jgi:membrane-associated phospholipid phosphatase
VSLTLHGGVELLRFLEAHRTPMLTAFFVVWSGLGSTIGYLLMLPLLWWGISWKLGARLFVALVLSVYLNALVKDVVARPRPFLSTDITSVTTPDEYSFPSGHAQNAALFWGLLALHFRRRWFHAVAAAVTLLVGFSRLYLGVHFPSDVLAGWLAGFLLAWLYALFSSPVAEAAERLPLGGQLSLSLGVPALLTVLHSTVNTAAALGGLAGALGGLAVGRMERLYPNGSQTRSRRAWLLVGLCGLPVLYLSLRLLSPGTGSPFYHLYLWMRFAAIGLWVSFLVPRLVSLGPRRERTE